MAALSARISSRSNRRPPISNRPKPRKSMKRKKSTVSTLAEAHRHVRQCCFAGKRIVVFSGGAAKSEAGYLSTKSANSTKAAATAPSSAAIPSSARAIRRWSCSMISSRFIKPPDHFPSRITFSMRRSGTNHCSATSTYSNSDIRESTNAKPMPDAYKSRDNTAL